MMFELEDTRMYIMLKMQIGYLLLIDSRLLGITLSDTLNLVAIDV